MGLDRVVLLTPVGACGSGRRAVGPIGELTPLVGLLPALMPRSPLSSREYGSCAVSPQTPVADRCRCRPGEITWRLVMGAHGGKLIPAACHSSASVLPPAIRLHDADAGYPRLHAGNRPISHSSDR